MDISDQHCENATRARIASRSLHRTAACKACAAARDSHADADPWPLWIRASVMLGGGVLCWAGLLQGAGRLIALFGRG